MCVCACVQMCDRERECVCICIDERVVEADEVREHIPYVREHILYGKRTHSIRMYR